MNVIRRPERVGHRRMPVDKIMSLTSEQTAALAEFRDRYFAQATSTEPADRPRAEAAVRRMAEIAGAKAHSVAWVRSPAEGVRAYETARANLRNSLGDSLWGDLRNSLWDSLGDSLWGDLRNSLWDSLGDSLWDDLRNSLWFGLGDSLWGSLWWGLRDSLGDSLVDSLWDAGWLAFYSFPAAHLGVVYDEKSAEMLRLWNEIAASCFALWIVPGTIILCERPASVDVQDGRLVDLTWRRAE